MHEVKWTTDKSAPACTDKSQLSGKTWVDFVEDLVYGELACADGDVEL
jgi:phage FluMu gp28-like protein